MSSRPFRLPFVSVAAGNEILASSLFRNAGWLLFDRGFRFLVVFASGVLVTRYLGPTEAGSLGNALAIAAILAGLCDLGLDSIVRLEVISAPHAHGRILGSAAALRLIAAPVAFLLFAWILSRDSAVLLHPGLILGVGLTLLSPAVLVLDSWFQSQTEARYSVWAQTAGLTLGAALRGLGVVLGFSLSWFGWAAGIEVLLMAALLAAVYRRRVAGAPRWTFDFGMARHLLTQAWPLGLTNLAILVYMRIDVVLLAQLRGEHEVGLYTAATRLTEAGYVIPIIAVNTLFPQLARQYAEDRSAFSRTLNLLLVGVAWTGLAASVSIALTAPWLIQHLYGSAFADSATVLTILAFNSVFAGLGAVRAQWLILHGLQRFGLYYVALGAGLNLVLNTLFIPHWGAVGAGVASLSTQCFVVLIAPLFFVETRPSVPLLLRAFVTFPRREVGS